MVFRKFWILLFLILAHCNTEHQNNNDKKVQEKESLFKMVDPSVSNIYFKNEVSETLSFNFLNYAYIYNGGGIAVGDINNDGLEDLYFSSNQHSNKLYLNKGNFVFEDITEKAGVEDATGWTTGVSMIDINNDGWIDIYVCKSGSLHDSEKRKNKLYINQRDGTFLEQAKVYGLDSEAYSTQAYYLDYDKDGDVDMYLVNHRADFNNNVVVDPRIQNNIDPESTDQLFENVTGKFKNLTQTSGILNKAWGLSAAIGDFNEDGWPDIYVANDFLEPDFLYINNKDGTFINRILETFDHISANSMGSDYADINNDLKPDLIVLDMLAEDHQRSKENMATMSTDNFKYLVNIGYHHQYMSNMLQLNLGDGSYSEIGQLSGIAKTDWSWAPLIADFDNNGYNDLLVTNGIKHDLSNQDFRNRMRNNILNQQKVTLQEAIGMMPSTTLENKIFSNAGTYQFQNKNQEWGLHHKINSNGAAYVDLDNDGDLDIVLNNQDDIASIYQNQQSNNYISIALSNPENNNTLLGTRIKVYTNQHQQMKMYYTCRGFQSSVTNNLHFGLGKTEIIDSIVVNWPNNQSSSLKNVAANQKLYIDYKKKEAFSKSQTTETVTIKVHPSNAFGVTYKHQETRFDDYALQLLLPQKQSEKGTPIAVADVNNDGLEDFFVGNARGASAMLYIQDNSGSFSIISQNTFEQDSHFEDRKALFFDYDNDGDLDLYVASGSYEDAIDSSYLQDRIYENNGQGNFTRKENLLPKIQTASGGIAIADFDNDQDEDIFIGGGFVSSKYPSAYPSYILKNENGKFIDATQDIAKDLSNINQTNDALFSDYDNDGDLDLMVVGEWSSPTILENKKGKFETADIKALNDLSGWFFKISSSDIDNDGDIDYLLGNLGENNKFHPSTDKPFHIYAKDFDADHSTDIVLSKTTKKGVLLPVRGKECSSQQIPRLSEKFKTYNSFATASLPEIYGQEALNNAIHYTATCFTSLLLKNKGQGNFDVQELPIIAQFGPTSDFLVKDFNQDGYKDIFGIGSLYEAETETIRYDGNKGYFLFGNTDQTQFASYLLSDTLQQLQAKACRFITIKNKKYILIFAKNNELKFLEYKFETKNLHK